MCFRRTKPPSAIVRDVSVEAKMQERERLRAALAAVEEENKRLETVLEPKRQKVYDLQKKVSESRNYIAQVCLFANHVNSGVRCIKLRKCSTDQRQWQSLHESFVD